MSLTEIHLEQFTGFEEITVNLSPGINVLVGTNGTGKTHLMKVAYAACDITKSKMAFPEKLARVFLPSGGSIGRLVKRQKGSSRCSVEVRRNRLTIKTSFSNHAQHPNTAHVFGAEEWCRKPMECVFIPVKEMLSNAPGFRSLYNQREIHFEEVYADILDRAYRPPPRGPADKARRQLMKSIQTAIHGKVTVAKEEFFLRNKQGNLEFTLLAEGMRKLGLLWLLIQNGTLLKGSVLFWDEPETNLNPSLYGALIEILLQLQRQGVQVILATHDYVVLKEIDLRQSDKDEVVYHSFFTDRETGRIATTASKNYREIHPNAIADTYADLYDRDVARSIGKSR